METRTFILICVVVFLAYAAATQTRGASEFQITKITKNLISAPQFAYTGAEQYQTNQRDRWLEVEVEFSAAPEFTDELTFKYYILFNGKLLTGEVSHTNIAAGTSNRSVMYVSPRTLARFGGNRPVITLDGFLEFAQALQGRPFFYERFGVALVEHQRFIEASQRFFGFIHVEQ